MEALSRTTLALLGARGSGKSTVGPLVAGLVQRPWMDLDDEVLSLGRRAGFPAASTGELLIRAGLARFRDLEAAALRRVLEPSLRVVLSTGGGVVEREDNRSWLQRSAYTVFLSVPVDALRARLHADPTPRPALLSRDPAGDGAEAEVEAVLARREPLYRACADLVLECGSAAPSELAERIVRSLPDDLRRSA